MSRDDLEDRLETLLRGNGLDLPVRQDAIAILESGVRRVRRRRRAVQAAVPAALTAAAIAVGFLVLPDGGAATSGPNVLGQYGIGQVSLGMTVGEAQADSLIGASENPESQGPCQRYPGTGPVELVEAREGVIVRIQVDPMADTSAGIHVGSSYAELQAAYPELNEPSGLPPKARVLLGDTGTTRYEFGLAFDPPGTNDEPNPLTPQTEVNSIELSTVTQTC